jgi:hypothetical protein
MPNTALGRGAKSRPPDEKMLLVQNPEIYPEDGVLAMAT